MDLLCIYDQLKDYFHDCPDIKIHEPCGYQIIVLVYDMTISIAVPFREKYYEMAILREDGDIDTSYEEWCGYNPVKKMYTCKDIIDEINNIKCMNS
jgi:hypothetical protein